MSLDQVVGQELEWSQPEFMRRYFTLRNDSGELATLRFDSRSLATGECDGASWTFKRTGFLSPKVTVRAVGSEVELAVFTPTGMGGGSVVFSSGARFQMRSKNFWRTEWVFESEDGSVLATLAGRPHVFKDGGVATVAQLAAHLPETPVLLLLLWYVRVIMHEESAASAAVVAAI